LIVVFRTKERRKHTPGKMLFVPEIPAKIPRIFPENGK